MLKKFSIVLTFLLLSTFVSANDFEDNFCGDKLHGTFSKDTCYATCKNPEASCRVAQTHKAKYNEELEEDLDCYGCAVYESCYDIGYIPWWPDCPTNCEVDPKKQCVRSIPLNNPLGIGPSSMGVPNTINGQACYACIDKKDECSRVWPDTSWFAQCLIDCAGKPNHRCVQKGIHPVEGYGCFECKDFGPPVEQCKDHGAIPRIDCATKCKPNEHCWPTGPMIMNAVGIPEMCFSCIPKIQLPPWPPNPPWPPPRPLTCEDYGWQTPVIKCNEKTETKQTQQFRSTTNVMIDCERCIPGECIPHPPQYTHAQCQAECESEGGVCRGKTRVRGEPDCYTCVMPDDDPPPETCVEAGMADGCDPFPCSEGEVCKVENVKLASGKKVKCGICYLDDTIPPDQCEKYEMYPNCAPCYQASHSCRMQKVQDDPELHCAECYIQCYKDGAVPGDCSLAGTCPEDKPVCIETEDQCHTCHAEPKCEDVDGSYTNPDCNGACKEGEESCEKEEFFDYDGGDPLTKYDCYECVEIPTCEDDEGLYTPSDCNGDCEKDGKSCIKYPYNEFFDVDCYSCEEVSQEDLCGDRELLPGQCPGTCSENEACVDRSIGDKAYCYECEEKETCEDKGELSEAQCRAECTGDKACDQSSLIRYSDNTIEPCYECNDKSDYSCEEQYPNPGICGTDNCEEVCQSNLQTRCHRCVSSEDQSCSTGYHVGACPAECSETQECEDDASSYHGEKCHRCKEKETCEDKGELSEAQCRAECTGDKACDQSSLIRYSDNTIEPCYECNDKSDYSCEEQYPNPGICGTDNCEEVCQSNLQTRCHRCVSSEDQSCSTGYHVGACPAECSETQECEDDASSYHGEKCHKCKDKEDEEKTCLDFDLSYGSCGDCPEGTTCLAVATEGISCFECIQKGIEDSCAERGFLTNDQCDQCPEGQVCVGERLWLKEGRCYSCKSEDDIICYGYMAHPLPGACTPSACSEGQICQTANNGYCHRCIDEKDKACSYGYHDGACPAECSETEVCKDDLNDYPTKPCHRCEPKPTELHPRCSDGSLQGICPGTCSEGQYCQVLKIEGENCHICRDLDSAKKMCDSDGVYPGGCPGTCSEDEHCIVTKLAMKAGGHPLADGIACHMCEPMEEHQCRVQAMQEGGCSKDACKESEKCIETTFDYATCHYCHDAQSECFEAGYLDNCFTCDESKQQCEKVSVNKRNPYGLGTTCWKCREDYVPEACSKGGLISDCLSCNEEDEECIETTYKGRKCYYCSEDELEYGCVDFGYYANCVICDSERQDCKATWINDGESERQCFYCANKEMKRSCKEGGYYSKAECDKCKKKGGVCRETIISTQKGEKCYECIEESGLNCERVEMMSKAQCDRMCISEGFVCNKTSSLPSGDCFQCEEEKRLGCTYGLLDEWACDDCIDGGKSCIPAGKANDGTQCYTCEEDPLAHCTGDGEYADTNCNGECSDNEECFRSIMNELQDQTGRQDCYTCVEKLEHEKCATRELLAGSCPGTCSEGQICKRTMVDDAACHSCRDKEHCSDKGLYGDANNCNRNCADGACTQRRGSDYEDWCWECITIGQEIMCSDNGLFPGICTERSCETGDEGSDCRNIPKNGLKCHDCYSKEQEETDEKCDSIEMFGGACPGICEAHEKCEQQSHENVVCYQCSNPCEDADLNVGGCPGSCSEEQKCDLKVVEGKNCHECSEKESCEDKGQFKHEACLPTCDITPCVMLGYDDYGYRCYRCPDDSEYDDEREDECESDSDCDDGDFCTDDDCIDEQCISTPIDCPGDEVCDPATGECVSEDECADDTDCDDGDLCTDDDCIDGQCISSPIACYGEEICDPATGECVSTEEDEKECDLGSDPGDCPYDCGEGFTCFPARNNCHVCEPNESIIPPESCAGIGLLDEWGCDSCLDGGSSCDPAGTAPNGEACFACNEEDKTCYHSQQQDGACQSGSCDSGSVCKDFDYNGIKCHWCQVASEEEAQCSDGFIPGACFPGACYGNAKCIQSAGPCRSCMQIESIEITYVVIIIETPRYRYVLGKDSISPTSLANFEPASILSLAKVDTSKFAGAQEMIETLKGQGASIGSLKDIGNMLKEKFGNKKKRYNDNCFDDFKAPKVPPAPPGVNSTDVLNQMLSSMGAGFGDLQGMLGGGGGGLPQLPDNPFGKDVSKNIKTDGPMIACGKTDGKESLAVFDANGALIENVSKKDLLKAPGKILDMLKKAESSYQQALSLKSLTPQDLLKKAKATLLSKITQQRAHEDKDRRKEEEKAAKQLEKKNKKLRKKGKPEIVKKVIDPNDPLFFYEEEKKKKFLGVLGSSAKVVSSTVMDGPASSKAKRSAEEIKDQWGIQAIGFTPRHDPDSAWNIIDGREKNVIVAIIDSGLDMTHPDAPQYIWTNMGEIPNNGIDDDNNGYVDDIHGWNFIDNNNVLKDTKGHGTFVAGIIAANADNDEGIAGINPGAIIMPLRVVAKDIEASSFNIYRAVHYAVNNGARLINISLGSRGVSQLEQAAINYAHDQGVFVAIASGNTNDYLGDMGPASARNAFTVGAIDTELRRSTISSYGPNNAIMAPGDSIISIRSVDSFNKRAFGPDSLARFYYRQSGTSFSTPMVVAVASLMLTKDPALTNIEIADILMGTATDMNEEGWDWLTGAGLLNAKAALEMANKDFLIVKISELRVNRSKKKKFESLDVFATVRGGMIKDFVVEVGKGKRAKKFKQVSGPFTEQANDAWVARIPKDNMRGSKEWIVRITVKTKDGQKKVARALLELE